MQLRLSQSVARARRIRPHGVALIDGDRRWTWSELADRTARLAGALQALGLQPGDRAAMLSLNTHRYIEFFQGAVWAGGVMMPLNHRLSTPELAAQLADAEPMVLLVSREFAETGLDLARLTPSIRHLILADDGPSLEGLIDYEAALAEAGPAPECLRTADDLACLFYTGGTTGRPKGVMLSHGNLFQNALNTIPVVQMDETCAHLHAGPLFHVAAGARVFTTAIVAGAHVVAPRFAVPEVLDVIEAAGVTHATFVTTMLQRIVDDPVLAGYRLPSLRCVSYGASPTPAALLKRAMQRLSHVSFVQSYGMTETSPVLTMLRAEDHAREELLASAGRPVFSAEVRVVDSADRDAPAGQVGEILGRGPMIMQGYWRNPEATAQALRGGWMHTGDLGYLDDEGFLFVVDRLKDMIISGGENVYSSEVEQVLALHPDIAECAVFGLPDDRWGERVHAVVVPRAGASLAAEALDAHCRAVIAAYKCPRSYDIRSENLPLSNVNKVLKSVLRAEALARE